MSMKMKINVNDSKKIQYALDMVNGRSTSQVGDSLWVRDISESAEMRLEKAQIPSKYRKGSSIRSVSGERLPNSYGYRAPARTVITLTRFSKDWFLTDLSILDGIQNPPTEYINIPEEAIKPMLRNMNFTLSSSD